MGQWVIAAGRAHRLARHHPTISDTVGFGYRGRENPMREDLKLPLQAQVIRDGSGRVRTIRHSQERWASEKGSSPPTAISHRREMASAYEFSRTELASPHVPAAHVAGCNPVWYGATADRSRPSAE